MQDIKQQEEMLKRFDEKFPDELIRDGDINQWSQNDEIKRFIQSEILLAVEQEKERIINGIDKMERDCLCSPLQTEVCDIERTFRRTQHRIITLINNK